jgi:hypothetical protein
VRVWKKRKGELELGRKEVEASKSVRVGGSKKRSRGELQ